MIYRNKKNGKLYEFVGTAIDATNERSGIGVIVYKDVETNRLYVRETVEFNEKFVPHKEG